MPRNRSRIAAALTATALAAGGVGAAAVELVNGGSRTVTTSAPQTLQVAANVSSQLTVGDIARKYTPSVVEVVATTSGASSGSPYPFGQSRSSQAEGTGWVYDTSGHIVTNEHVIDGASSVKVVFSDGTSATATIVGRDISTDLAVLQVSTSKSLTPLTLGNSSAVAVGDGVVAIGDPFGLTGTVTSGIVSAVGREINATNGAPIEGAIQTDAAINHGNSGGPLFDLSGQVIGITSQIESDSGGSDGVGFAIPSNTIKQIVSELVSSGTAQHAFLGVSPQTVAGSGVRVGSVQSGTAASKAGLKAGDVITAVNGTATTSSSALRAAIASHKPGDTVTLKILRNGATKTLQVTLGSQSA
jgi:putative serine protease PepD